MKYTKSQAVLTMSAIVPYALVCWGYVTLTDGGAKNFWIALGALLAIRLFFGVIEAMGSAISWRVYGKKLSIQKNLAVLRANNFPRRKYAHDDFLNYLARIEEDPECPQQVRLAAKEFEFVLRFFEESSILAGMRIHAAADEALEIYSPKSEAPSYAASAA